MNKPWKILTSFAPPTKRRLLRRSRNARLLAQALAVVALCAAAEAVRADDVPAFGNWEHYHFSLDPTPIEVRFVHDRGSRDFPALKIPRSYVVYANGAEPSTKGPLPALVETNNVQIAFADPDGKAWSVAIDAHAKEDSPSPRRRRNSAAAASVHRRPKSEYEPKHHRGYSPALSGSPFEPSHLRGLTRHDTVEERVSTTPERGTIYLSRRSATSRATPAISV